MQQMQAADAGSRCRQHSAQQQMQAALCSAHFSQLEKTVLANSPEQTYRFFYLVPIGYSLAVDMC